ncbi:MAG: hypothetical protein IT437_11580 [Phycisphaerales bacterium]|nr:hypothetical protein [Phycisphaerales bacterium]
MLKLLRKYNKWIMVVGGSLLMLAFLVPQAIQQFGADPRSQVVARLDGEPIRASDENLAQREIHALKQLTGGYLTSALQLDDGVTHWLLLKTEAREGGFIGESGDGVAWIPALAGTMAEGYMDQRYGDNWRNPQIAPLFAQIYGKDARQMLADAATTMQTQLEQGRARAAAEAGMSVKDVDMALAEARGVFRMFQAYVGAARMSDRLTAYTARERLDSAYADIFAVPASKFADAVPTPDDAALRAFVDRFKTVRPGQGEFGIGYLLPQRVKLEWLTLDAPAIQAVIPADPVEVRKRYLQNRTKYPGEFDAERSKVEADYRAEKLAQVMTEAHRVIQAQVLQVTRRLQADGRYRKVPADWESMRPHFDTIAQAVVKQVESGTGIKIPLPAVTHSDRWMTQAELSALPDLGRASFQTGNQSTPLVAAVMGVRELLAPGQEPVIPVQVGIPVTDTFFTDAAGSRYYITVLAARPESEPESLDEVRERATTDYKNLKSYETLVARLPEWRSLAVSAGLDAVRDSIFPPPPQPEGGGPMPADDRPGIARRARVFRLGINPGEGGQSAVALADTEPARKAIMDAADAMDPLTPPDKLDPDRSTVAAGSPEKLAAVIARITALRPLTSEEYRAAGTQLAGMLQNQELRTASAAVPGPFSLEKLKERHVYVEEESRRRSAPEEAPAPPPVPSGL